MIQLLVALVLLYALAPTAAADEDKFIQGPAHVLDGGTLVVGEHTVRLHGIVVPSARQKCLKGALPWLCGAAARSHLVSLVEGKKVRCMKQGRHSARCFAGTFDIAERMVSAGWAVPDTDGPGYRGAEDNARTAKRGLWEFAQ